MMTGRGVHGLGKPKKPGQTHPKNQKNGMDLVIGWILFLKMENP